MKFHKNCDYTGKILKILCVRCNSVKLDIPNSRAPMRNVFLALLQMIYYIQGRTSGADLGGPPPPPKMTS